MGVSLAKCILAGIKGLESLRWWEALMRWQANPPGNRD